jgi:glycerol-3-phosphate dehydrogenase (NAD(P)+)
VPIIEQVAAVVHEGRTPQQVVESLLARARKAEVD